MFNFNCSKRSHGFYSCFDSVQMFGLDWTFGSNAWFSWNVQIECSFLFNRITGAICMFNLV